MKRTLSLLLSLILLCGMFVPAVHAEGPNSYRVEIECPNWHTEMDPAKMTYTVKTPGFRLTRQPVFIATDPYGQMYDETGLRQQDLDYYLAVGLNTDKPVTDGDEITVVVNGYESDSYTVQGSHLSESLADAQFVGYVSVSPYMELEHLSISAVYLEPGRRLEDVVFIPGTGDMEVTCKVDVHVGGNLEAPVMKRTDTFAAGQEYFFEFELRADQINHRVYTDRTVVSERDPLEFLPELTVSGDPEKPESVRLYYRYRSNRTYKIEVLTDGKCEASVAAVETKAPVTEAEPGTPLYTTVNVPTGRVFDHWKTEGFVLPDDQKGNEKAVFDMPAGDIKLTAVTREANLPFDDVHPDDWFFRPVAWAYHAGVTRGVSATKFAPRMLCNRAQAVVLIQNADLLNPDVSDIQNPFTDVHPDDWFYDSVMWAIENDVASGRTPTTFAPKELVTRAEFCTMLWSIWDKPVTPCDLPFTDVSSDAYYYNAIQWCYDQGLISGVDETHFNPNGYLSRAEACTMLYADYSRSN